MYAYTGSAAPMSEASKLVRMMQMPSNCASASIRSWHLDQRMSSSLTSISNHPVHSLSDGDCPFLTSRRGLS